MLTGSKNPAGREESVPSRAKTLLSSFGYAFAGLGYCLRTQRNFRIHAAFALLGTVAGALLGLSSTEWAVFALMCVLVMSAEMVNSMVEALVDLVSPGYHPLAKISKDVAAGVVLLTAIGSLVVGLFLFGPKLLAIAHL